LSITGPIVALSDSIGDNVVALCSLGHVYATSGQREAAEKILTEVKRKSRHRYVSPFYVALIYVGLGRYGEAFEWLEKAYRERDSCFLLIHTDPALDPIRSHPRFATLAQRLPLPAWNSRT